MMLFEPPAPYQFWMQTRDRDPEGQLAPSGEIKERENFITIEKTE
jgi:hypothetical protein